MLRVKNSVKYLKSRLIDLFKSLGGSQTDSYFTTNSLKILKNSGLWDGKVCVLQVTNTSERTIELRALMSAPDASNAWNLRCHVREKLVKWLQKNYPQALPRLRAELNQLKEQKDGRSSGN